MAPSPLDLIAPPRCVGCGVRAPLPWCRVCLDEARRLRWIGGCPRCAGGCVDGVGCPLGGTAVVSTVAAFVYTDLVARSIVAGKVGGVHAVWRPFGAHLGAVVRAAEVDVDVVVPVATEPGRARRRGHDHAGRLARGVAEVLGVPGVGALAARRHTPDRGRHGGPRELPEGAFRRVRDLGEARVLLVDDVLTTAATVRAAVAALGSSTVTVAVLARAGR